MPKTITIPLELVLQVQAALLENEEETMHEWGELQKLVDAQRLIDNLSLAQQALNDAPVSADNRKLFDVKTGEILPVKNFTATDVINNTEAYFKNLAERIETKSDFDNFVSKMHDHLLVKAAMGKGDSNA